jgi:RND family efflux transporter MFP subunit
MSFRNKLAQQLRGSVFGGGQETMDSRRSLIGRSRVLATTTMLAAAAAIAFTGCEGQKAAPAPPPPDVIVTPVVQKDVPIYNEWVATLDGFDNAQIQPQVTGYIVAQTYREGSPVKKGQVLFEIDPRPFQAILDQAKAQLAQAQAQLGKTKLDVDRDTPLAKERAIAQSQLDNDIQANLAAIASVKSSEAQVEQAQLNLDFCHVTSLLDGIAGIATVQIGNLVSPTAVLTSVSRVEPIKAYFPISEQTYMKFAKRINTASRRDDMEAPKDTPTLQLILADGTVYAHPGKILYTDRQVDITTGTIRIASAFPNPENILRPGQFGRIRAATEQVNGALLVPQKAVNELQGMYQLAVVGEGNKVSIRSVKVGDRSGENWIIQDGVKPGEMVIVEGLQKVREGSVVKPKQQAVPDSGAPGASTGTAKGA